MSHEVEWVLRAATLGIGATFVMDAWGLLLRQFGIPSLNLAFLGRWLGHLPQGTLIHEKIAQAKPVTGEIALGWCAHYGIGVGFASLLLAVSGLSWAHAPTVLPALAVGVVTVLAPWFLLQPALGAGVLSRKTSAPLFNSMKSLATHTVFGLGLYLTALATGPLIPNAR